MIWLFKSSRLNLSILGMKARMRFHTQNTTFFNR